MKNRLAMITIISFLSLGLLITSGFIIWNNPSSNSGSNNESLNQKDNDTNKADHENNDDASKVDQESNQEDDQLKIINQEESNNYQKGSANWFLQYANPFFYLEYGENTPNEKITAEGLSDADELDVALVYFKFSDNKNSDSNVAYSKSLVQNKIIEYFGNKSFSYISSNECNDACCNYEYLTKQNAYHICSYDKGYTQSYAIDSIKRSGNYVTVVYSVMDYMNFSNPVISDNDGPVETYCGTKAIVYELNSGNYNFVSLEYNPNGNCKYSSTEN